VVIARISTVEIKDDRPEDNGKDLAASALGKRGGRARAETLTPEQCAEILSGDSWRTLSRERSRLAA
jgi:hypothetical protein